MMLFFTIEELKEEVDKGYISRRVHPEDDNVAIYNYTPFTVFERHWNEMTLNSRGLVIDEKEKAILARPFKKFFNYGEDTGLGEVKIPRNEKPEVTTKHDGSLGISYRLKDGKVRWATRGSFDSDQAKVAQEIWDKKYSHLDDKVEDRLTLMVEIIDPRTKVVVDYEGASDLILIGAKHTNTGNDLSHWDIKRIARNLGMPYTKRQWISLEYAKLIQSDLTKDEEGYVFRWLSNGLRLKVKSDRYMDIHRIAYGVSKKMKVEKWASGELTRLIRELPEEFREEIEVMGISLTHKLNLLAVKAYLTFYKYQKASIGRKDFAMRVQKEDSLIKSLMFMIMDEKGSDKIKMKIKEHIYRNYKDFTID